MPSGAKLAGILVALFATVAPLCVQAQHIVPTRNTAGHLVYVNDEDNAPAPPTATPMRQRPALVYWSNTEHRWKPVPASSPSAKAARSAAAEVASLMHARNDATLYASATLREAARAPRPSSPNIERAIDEAAARHHVDPSLVRAVIKVESNFNPHAVSRAGAMGLMQLMPDTARGLNVYNPFDPQQNIDGGVRHLKRLLQTFNGNVSLSLAAYNAGEKAVLRRFAVPQIAETQSYVRQITSIYSGGPALPEFPARVATRIFRDASGRLTMTSEE